LYPIDAYGPGEIIRLDVKNSLFQLVNLTGEPVTVLHNDRVMSLNLPEARRSADQMEEARQK
jgi:hypothetical protein